MNASLLSLFLALVMLFNGGNALPPEPEEAATLSFHDFRIYENGTQILNVMPHFNLTSAPGTSHSLFHFDVTLNDKPFAPCTLDLSHDSLRFSMAGQGRSYTMSLADMNDQISVDNPQLTEQLIPLMGRFISSAGDLLAPFTSPDTDLRKMAAEQLSLTFSVMNASVTDTTLEIDGASYPAKCYTVTPSLADYLTLYDMLMEKDMFGYKNYLTCMLDMINLATGAHFTSYSQLLPLISENMEAFPKTTLPVVIAETPDKVYIKTESVITNEAGETAPVKVLAVYEEKGFSLSADMTLPSPDYDDPGMNFHMEASFLPHSWNAILSINGASSYAYDETTVSTGYDTMLMQVYGENTENDTLFNAKFSMVSEVETFENGQSTGSEKLDETDMSFSVRGQEAEMGKTYLVQAGISQGDFSSAFQFEMDLLKTAVPDYFAGMENLTFSEETAESLAPFIQEDLMSLYDDLMILCEDQDVADFLELLDIDPEDIKDMAEELIPETEEEEELPDHSGIFILPSEDEPDEDENESHNLFHTKNDESQPEEKEEKDSPFLF